MALVLVVAMVPVVVATAVAQGGMPGLRMEDHVDPNELVGLTPEQVHVIPEAHPLHGPGIFTWRNAILGAVSCAALLVTSVVAYMTMWALGIGPVGSLLAQGLIVERDPVVLAGFDNLTDDPSLAAFVTDAFELELAMSQVVTLVSSEVARSVAVAMGADPFEPLSQATARRVAQQEGMRLVVAGDVTRRGSGYLLSATLLQPSGTVVARFEESSSGEDDLLSALEGLSERLRERLGESLRVIREGERLAPIVTESVEALRLYRQSGRASTDGDRGGAIDLLEQALLADPTFAMGWRRLGVLSEQAADPDRARVAYQRVIDLWGPGGRAERTVEHMRERLSHLDE
jgi:hypothetical protein